MQKIFRLAPLVFLLLLSGCRSYSLKETLPISIVVIDNKPRFTNSSGKNLHNVRLNGEISDGLSLHSDRKWRRSIIEVWVNGEHVDCNYRFNAGVQEVWISGWCDEGPIKGYWTWQVSRD